MVILYCIVTTQHLDTDTVYQLYHTSLLVTYALNEYMQYQLKQIH